MAKGRPIPSQDFCTRRHGAAFVLSVAAHPGQWSDALRRSVIGTLRAARTDPGEIRVILTGANLFDANGDVGTERADLLACLQGPGAPVVAAIPGAATGLGLELALGCQARVGHAHSRYQLPGIGAGRLPVNGAVIVLTALIGAAATLEMVAFGTVVDAKAAHRIGLIDAIAADDLLGLAASIAVPARPVGNATADIPALRAAVRRRAPGQAAPLAALHAIELSSRLPRQHALAETRRLAAALAGSAEALALRHAATLSRQTVEPADVAALRWALLREAIYLIDDGAVPDAVDRALRGFGFTDPPLLWSDRFGLLMVAQTLVDPVPNAWRHYSPTLDLLIDAGRLGRATLHGWYRYAGKARLPQADPDLDLLLADAARARRHRRRPVDTAEIVARCIAALRTTAAPLSDAVADAASLQIGFPDWRGGLRYHASTAEARADAK